MISTSEPILYDPNYPINIPHEYDGTYQPNRFHSWFLRAIFYLIPSFISIIRICLRIFRNFQSASIPMIRQPFLAIIMPPRHPFYIYIHNLDNFPLYEIHSLTCKPSNCPRAVLYIHGGGFVSGDFAGFKAFIAEIAVRLSCPVFFPQYRLAPEHSAMDLIADVIEAYNFITTSYTEIVLMGDSAGACLCLWLLYSLQSSKISSVILYSPITDLNGTGDSMVQLASIDPILVPSIVKTVMQYVNDLPSPLMLPPFNIRPRMCIFVGAYEIMLDDSRRFVARPDFQHAYLHIIPKGFHCWQNFINLPEAQMTLDMTSAFILS